MARFLSPVALSHLQAFRYWLHSEASEWDISLPEDEPVEEGKEYPQFHLYRHGVSVGMVESPLQALEKIGDSKLLQEYDRLAAEDSDNLEVWPLWVDTVEKVERKHSLCHYLMTFIRHTNQAPSFVRY